MRSLTFLLGVLVSAATVTASLSANETAPPSSETRALYICSARSLLGKRFSETGEDKALTQEAALRKCEAAKFRCYKTGCADAAKP